MSANEPSAAVAVETFFPVSVFEAVTVTPGSGVTPALIVPRTRNCGTPIAGACCGGAGAAADAAAAVVCAEPATAYSSSAQPAAASRNSGMTDFFIELLGLTLLTGFGLGLLTLTLATRTAVHHEHSAAILFHAACHFGRNDVHGCWNERSVLQFAAGKDGVANFDVGHGDTFIASFAKRGVLIGLNGLLHAISTRDCELRRIDRLHVTNNHGFAHGIFHALLHLLHLRLRGTFTHDLSCPGFVAGRIAADHHVIANFEIGKLSLLTAFAEARVGADVHGADRAIAQLDLEC